MADYIIRDDKNSKDILIELRESTGMNRHQFCEYFDIPYMTVSDWEHGKKRVPKYFLRLLEYYVKMEQMDKKVLENSEDKISDIYPRKEDTYEAKEFKSRKKEH